MTRKTRESEKFHASFQCGSRRCRIHSDISKRKSPILYAFMPFRYRLLAQYPSQSPKNIFTFRDGGAHFVARTCLKLRASHNILLTSPWKIEFPNFNFSSLNTITCWVCFENRCDKWFVSGDQSFHKFSDQQIMADW